MKTLNVGKILLLCAFVIGLASCGDDVYYTMENDDQKLCDRTWIDEYETEEGLPCTYQLRFYKVIVISIFPHPLKTEMIIQFSII